MTDVDQNVIKADNQRKLLRQRASRQVAKKRLHQRQPVATVRVEGVHKELVVANQICSKSASLVTVHEITSLKTKPDHATKSCAVSPSYRKAGHMSTVMATTTPSHFKAGWNPKLEAVTIKVNGNMFLMLIICQHLLMSGDVELNPGPLDVLDLRSITNELGSVIHKRFQIGVQLGLREAKLRQIEADHYHTVDRCFSEVISFWLNGNTQVAVTWKSLIGVLESSFVDEKGLAKELREKGGLEPHDGKQVSVLSDDQTVTIQVPVQKAETSVAQLTSVVSTEAVNLPPRDSIEYSHDLPQPKPKFTFPSLDVEVATQVPAQKVETSIAQSTSSVSTEDNLPPSDSTEDSQDLPRPKAKFTFPSLDLKKMSKEEKERLHQRLFTESMDITFKFQKLFSSTILSLKNRDISPQDLFAHLSCLGKLKPTYDDDSNDPKPPILRHYFPQIKNAVRIEEAMGVISNYCSFFNYHIIEMIIDMLGTAEDKDNLSAYKKEYAKRHVFECPSELGAMTDGNAELLMTLDETYDDCTVSTLKLFERKLAEILKLSNAAGLKLCHIEPGSLKLTFQIPILMQKDIFPLSLNQKRALAGLGVVQLSCGDYHFSHEDEEIKIVGVVVGVSEVTGMVAGVGEVAGMVAGLSVGKPDDGESIADSAFETCSGFSGATSAGTSNFSEMKETLMNGWMNIKPGAFGLLPRTWSKRWCVLKERRLYYYKSPHDTSAAGVVNMSGYSITSAPELKKPNVFKVLRSKSKTYYFQAISYEDMIKWTRALRDAARLSSTSSKYHTVGMPVVGQVADKGKGGASVADSAIGTSTRQSVITGGTFVGGSQFSEDIAERDLTDEPYLTMEHDAAKLQPPNYSSRLELHQASRRGKLNEVKRLVENQHHNPLQKDKYGNTALHYAAAGGDLRTLKYFIEEQGLVPACQGAYGWTPLHHAARNKHLELVQYLVSEQQVDPLCKDEDGDTSLHTACGGGDIDVIRFLINEIKQYMSLEEVIYERANDGSTPLHIAALNGHLLVVKFFITDMNFDPNTPGFMGRPALHYAAQEGQLEVVKYLIEEGKCDPSYCTGEEKVTPLHIAAQCGHLDVVRYLTQHHHSNPLSRDSNGNTPLHDAALTGRFKVVEFFISELNCDPNTPGQWGRSPLHVAATRGRLEIVKYLIEKINCNASQVDKRKVTPLHVAAVKGHLDVVRYLIQDKLCNPLCRSNVRDTPLHYAAREGHLEVVKYYIETLHCSPNIRGWRFMTPLEQARSNGHTHVVNYLKS